MKRLHIVIDFDGVIVTMEYPNIGVLMTGAVPTINKWHEQGHTITINTCRAGAYANNCKEFLNSSEIKHHFFNENDPVLIEQYNTDTRRISGDVYIDDKNLGGFMGWKKADEMITEMANKKPVIICIVGKSGAGKSTLERQLYTQFSVPMIKSRTTRPPRYEGEQGHTFVSDAEFDTYQLEDKLAFTKFGDYRYCCLTKDVQDYNTYVIDEHGLKYLQEHFGDVYDIYSILVRCNLVERINRVGKERVDRDEGQFQMPSVLFDFIWDTDRWCEESHRREQKTLELYKFINNCLGRGWE